MTNEINNHDQAVWCEVRRPGHSNEILVKEPCLGTPHLSNKGTGGMECSVVLFKPRIHLFACTHLSVSYSLDCNDWLAFKHHSTSFCPNTWFLAENKHQSPLCVSNMFGLWLLVCVHASVSSLCFKHVWMVIPCLSTSVSHTFVQTRLDCGSLSVHKHQIPVLCPNTFGLWFPVCAHTSDSSPVSQTRLGCGCLSVYTHLSTALCFKHVCLRLLVWA